MSDYVRKKVIRYKVDKKILEDIEREIQEKDLYLAPEEILAERFGVTETYKHKINDFNISGGYDFENRENDLFLDYLLDYEYGAGGEFESVRLLTENEFNKYKELFNKYIKDIKRDELRLVHYSYYNGVDEPSVYEFEEV